MCLVYHNKGFTESTGRGSLWAELSDGRCRFVIAKARNCQSIEAQLQ